MKKIVIVGSGGFAKEVAFLIEDINKKKNEWNLLGYIDENIGESNGKYKVFNNDDWLETIEEKLYVVFGVGDPILTKKLADKFKSNIYLTYPNLIHPNVFGDWDKIILGKGNIICAGNIFTTDIKIGSFNVFNLCCTVGHDVTIESYNIINPSVNISGGVVLSNLILLGTGTQILQYKKIIDNVIVGAGSVVTKDVLESGVYVGSPVKMIKL
jgi:sugar O-acyltransferase (sialic acid O-acetyltransferase NeuD family)